MTRDIYPPPVCTSHYLKPQKLEAELCVLVLNNIPAFISRLKSFHAANTVQMQSCRVPDVWPGWTQNYTQVNPPIYGDSVSVGLPHMRGSCYIMTDRRFRQSEMLSEFTSLHLTWTPTHVAVQDKSNYRRQRKVKRAVQTKELVTE